MQILKFCKKLYPRHILKLLENIYKYEMDPTRTVGATERTRDAGRTDKRRDGLTDTEWNQYNFVVRGYNNVCTREANYRCGHEKVILLFISGVAQQRGK